MTGTAPAWPQPYRLLDAAPYWAALDDHRLAFQRCTACRDVVWPAHSFCPHCDARPLVWEQSAGRGTVWSFSTVMRGPSPVWAAVVPYTVGFVRLDEGYHLFTQIEAEPDDVVIGMPVAVRFVARGEQTLPIFGAV